MSIRDFIDLVRSENVAGAQKEFDSIVNTKLGERLEGIQREVTANALGISVPGEYSSNIPEE